MKHNPKVIPRIFGGIGNQLFIYSAARRLALVNRAELVLDDVTGFLYDHYYHRHYQLNHFNIPCRTATAFERLEPFSRPRRYLKRILNARFPFDHRSYIYQEGKEFDPRLLTLAIKGSLYLEGYWQSEGYFKDVEFQIRKDLLIKPPQDDQNCLMAQRIRYKQGIAVHVRFFDDPTNPGNNIADDNNTPADYYHRAISEMEIRVPGLHYFVFSDHPREAKARLPLSDGRMTIVNHNQGDDMAYADLWLMKQCQHFIIANSTFSWWGAWLADNPTKIVIAPGFEKRDGNMSWGFEGLLPRDWVKR